MAEAQDSRAHRRAIQRRHREKMASRRDDEIPYPATKECSRCGEMKPADAFALARQNRDGLKAHCRICEAKGHHGRTAGHERQRRMGTAQMTRLGIENAPPPIEDTPDGPIMRVPLTKGAHAVIDAADWPRIAGHVWFLIDSGYAVTNGDLADGRRGIIYMHVLLYGDPGDGLEVDHWDRNRLNNRRGNLRAATPSQNTANRAAQKNSRSPFKGVRQLPTGRWEARIGGNGRQRSLGTFDTAQQAAAAYDAAALDMFGAFAVPNITDET